MRLFFIACLVIIAFPLQAQALSCGHSPERHYIEKSEIVFIGTAIKNGEEPVYDSWSKKDVVKAYTDFKVTEVIKGEPGEIVRIYINSSPYAGGKRQNDYEEGKSYTIYPNRVRDEKTYSTGPCPVLIFDTNRRQTPEIGSPVPKESEILKEKKKAFDKLIQETEDLKYYFLKAELLEEYRDYQQSRRIFESVLKKIYDKNPQSFTDFKNARINRYCDGITDFQLEGIPYYIRPAQRPDYVSSQSLSTYMEALFRYGKTLYYIKEYENALPVLCVSQRTKADPFILQTIIQLGQTQLLDGKKLDLRKAILSQADLSNLILKNSDFSESKLQHFKFNNSDLSSSKFVKSDLRIEAKNANFSNTDLRNLTLYGDLTGSDLSHAKLNESHFSAKLEDVNLTNADLRKAKIRTQLKNANLTNANLREAVVYGLSGAILNNTNLSFISSQDPEHMNTRSDYTDVNLSNFNFTGSRFGDTDFSGAKFTNSDLTKADFKGSIFKNVDFSGANLSDADFSSSRYNPADLSGADLSQANLSGANFATALYSCETKFPEGFNPSANLMKNFDGHCQHESDKKQDITVILNPPHRHWRLMKDDDVRAVLPILKLTNNLACQWMAKDRRFPYRHSFKDQVLLNHDFSGCDPIRSDFTNTDLRGANFRGTLLYDVDLSTSRLDKADFNGARITTTSKFPQGFDTSVFKLVPTAVLNDASSAWAASSGGLKSSMMFHYKAPDYPIPDFQGENLDEIIYVAAWLPESNMEGASLRLTNLSASNLMGVNFKNANLTGAVLYDALLNNANFTNSRLYGADLRSADLTGAKLDGADLTNALYNEQTVWPHGFIPENTKAFYTENANSKHQ